MDFMDKLEAIQDELAGIEALLLALSCTHGADGALAWEYMEAAIIALARRAGEAVAALDDCMKEGAHERLNGGN